MTEYIILCRNDGNPFNNEDVLEERWTPIGAVHASSPSGAVRAQIQGKAGEYVAVPKRSWKPLTVKTEQVTKVTIG